MTKKPTVTIGIPADNEEANIKKHIDVINRYFYPVTAGIETVLLETYSVLVKNGWDITIHTSQNTLSEKNVLPDSSVINSLKVKRYPFNKLTFMPKLPWGAIDILALYNFDVFPHFYILLYCLGLKMIGKKEFKLFLSPSSGFNSDWTIFPKLVAIIKQLYHYTVGTFLINKVVDGVQAISEWEKDEMIKKGINPNLIRVIHHGVEKEAFIDIDKFASEDIKLLVEKIGQYIVQVARIHPIKNFETTIKAISKLPKDLKFLIVGPVQDLQYKKHLESLIKNLNLNNRVLFLGAVSVKDKYYLIKHAQMMVHMAIHEGYCIAVLEGMSQGLVCIVANNTALPYLIKDGVNGFCIETRDYKKVAEKINFVLENKNSEMIKKMQERNRIYALQNSWEKVSQKVEKLYASLVAQEK